MEWKAERVHDDTFASLGEPSAISAAVAIIGGVRHHGLYAGDLAIMSYGDTKSIAAGLFNRAKEPVGEIFRTFNDFEKVVRHESFWLEDDYQGRGVAKDVFREAMPFYQRIGMKRIEVIASSSGGGYAWARYGFVPDRSDWERLVRTLANRSNKPKGTDELVDSVDLANPKHIWRIADSDIGKELLRGRAWRGQLDLADAEQMRRFQTYVGASTKKNFVSKTSKKRSRMVAEELDEETPVPYEDLMRHRDDMKRSGAADAIIDALYPLPLDAALRSKADKLA
jgi:GNAT superfamily N-acetyltransferase